MKSEKDALDRSRALCVAVLPDWPSESAALRSLAKREYPVLMARIFAPV
jgi:hypothetical protein